MKPSPASTECGSPVLARPRRFVDRCPSGGGRGDAARRMVHVGLCSVVLIRCIGSWPPISRERAAQSAREQPPQSSPSPSWWPRRRTRPGPVDITKLLGPTKWRLLPLRPCYGNFKPLRGRQSQTGRTRRCPRRRLTRNQLCTGVRRSRCACVVPTSMTAPRSITSERVHGSRTRNCSPPRVPRDTAAADQETAVRRQLRPLSDRARFTRAGTLKSMDDPGCRRPLPY